jgi:hypothetical protein
MYRCATALPKEAARVWPGGYLGDPAAAQGDFTAASTHDSRHQSMSRFVADVAEAA